MEDFKSQCIFVEDNKTTFQLNSLPQITDTPLKAGEILRNSNGQYYFVCFHCGLAFEEFGEIINHSDRHFVNDEKYNIDIQPTEFALCEEPNPEELHQLNSSEPTPTSAETDLPVRRRRRRRAPTVKRKMDNEPMANIPQDCPLCGVWCDDFQNHIKIVHNYGNGMFQCFICYKYFKQFSFLKKHISGERHRQSSCYHCEMEPPITKQSDARRHKCLFCKQWFENHIEFWIHFKNAHNEDADHFFSKRKNCNIFTCYVCEREFPKRDYLVGHMRTHHEKFLRHQCPTCGKRVRTFGQLTQHLKVHEGKIFKCDKCDKQFQYYARLRLHMASHRTELNYKCEVCSKAFKIRKYLKTHMAVHTNDKKYACKFCDATFNFTSGRRAHEKSQHKAI